MFALLNSWWLWSLAALSVPLVIHLWDIRQGKVLKVGSISLMAAASKKSSRSFNLTDILLLIIRCTLLAVISLLLAQPIWQKKIAAAKAKGWVLIPKENLPEVYQKYRLRLDSLHKAGYELHEFGNSFNFIDSLQLARLLQAKPQTQSAQISDYWVLLNRLNHSVGPQTSVYLFTTAQLKHFSGSKPKVAFKLHWQTFTPSDSVVNWIEGAWLTPDNSIKVVRGISSPAATSYSYYYINNDHTRGSDFEVFANNGQLQIKLKNDTSAAVAIDTAVSSFAIYTDMNQADAGYIKAALQTIIQFTRHKAIIRQFNTAASIPDNQTWIFWLSDQPVPAVVLKRARHIIHYTRGKANPINSWVNTEPDNLLADQGTALKIYKSIVPKNDGGTLIWADGYGRPILSRLQQSGTNVYTFYSRFNPSWNELVWNEHFPELLLKLLNPQLRDEAQIHDRRSISLQQMTPQTGSSTHTVAPALIRQTNLQLILWLLAAALFLTERLLTYRTKNSASHG